MRTSVSSTTPSRPGTAAPNATALGPYATREEAEHAVQSVAEREREAPQLEDRAWEGDSPFRAPHGSHRTSLPTGMIEGDGPGRSGAGGGESTWRTSARWRIWSSGCWAAPVSRGAGSPAAGRGRPPRPARLPGTPTARPRPPTEVAEPRRGGRRRLEVSVQGGSNADVAGAADLVIVAVPFAGHAATLIELAATLAGKIVVDYMVPLGFDEQGAFALAVEEGSGAQQAAALLPDSPSSGRSTTCPPSCSRTWPGRHRRRRDGRRRRPRGHRHSCRRWPGGCPACAASTPASCATPARSRRYRQPRVGEPPLQGARRPPGHRRLAPTTSGRRSRPAAAAGRQPGAVADRGGRGHGRRPAGRRDRLVHPPARSRRRPRRRHQVPRRRPRLDLQPDLVIANAEENRADDLEALRAAGSRSGSPPPRRCPGADLARPAAAPAAARGSGWLDAVRRVWAAALAGRRAVVPIWRRPWMVLGRDTFAGDVLARLGVDNVLAGPPTATPSGAWRPRRRRRRPGGVARRAVRVRRGRRPGGLAAGAPGVRRRPAPHLVRPVLAEAPEVLLGAAAADSRSGARLRPCCSRTRWPCCTPPPSCSCSPARCSRCGGRGCCGCTSR